MTDFIKRVPVSDQDYHSTFDASGNPYFNELADNMGSSKASEIARFNAARYLNTGKESLELRKRIVALAASTTVAIATDLGGARSAFFNLFT